MLVWISRLQRARAAPGRRVRPSSTPPSSAAPAASAVRGWRWPAGSGASARSASMRAAAWLKLAAERGHLVAAVFGHALAAARRRRRPRRRCFSSSSRRVSRAHHRPGAGGDGHEQQHQQQRQPRPSPTGSIGHGHRGSCDAPARGPARRRRAGVRRPGRAPPARGGAGRRMHPQRAAVVSRRLAQRARGAHRGAGSVGGGDAPARRVVQRQRQAQPLRPVAQRMRPAPRAARRRRAASVASSSAQALDALAAPHCARTARSRSRWRCDQPARDQREQHQRRHHREVDAQVQRTHARLRAAAARLSASCFGEHVARAAHRQHAPRRLRVVLDDARGCARCARRCCGRRPPAGGPCSASMIWSRDSTRPGLRASTVSRSNWWLVRSHALAVEPRLARAEVDLQPAEAQHLVAPRRRAGRGAAAP